MYKLLSQIGYGGLEQKLVSRNSNLLNPLREVNTLEVWPNVMNLKGFSFLNGIVYYEKKQVQLVPYHSEFMHRSMVLAEYKA